MNTKDMLKEMDKKISDIEGAVFHFEEVLIPRMEADRKILDNLKGQRKKLVTLVERAKRGEAISAEEEKDAVPEVFQ